MGAVSPCDCPECSIFIEVLAGVASLPGSISCFWFYFFFKAEVTPIPHLIYHLLTGSRTVAFWKILCGCLGCTLTWSPCFKVSISMSIVIGVLSFLVLSQAMSCFHHFWLQQIVVGRSNRVLLLNRLCRGLAVRPCDEVFLWSMVWVPSWHFGSQHPDILLSWQHTLPYHYFEDELAMKSYAEIPNCSQTAEVYCGPLSRNTTSGMPCHAKWAFSFQIAVEGFVSGRWSISQKLI